MFTADLLILVIRETGPTGNRGPVFQRSSPDSIMKRDVGLISTKSNEKRSYRSVSASVEIIGLAAS